MAEFLEVDSLYLNGYDATPAESVSPYAIDAGSIDLSPAQRKYDWTETGYSAGSAMVGSAHMSNVERTWPIQVRARFTSGHTNLVTNPRPYSVVTGWQAEGTGSTVTYASYQTENVIQAVTTGSANSGMETSFTGTVAGYSGGVWVKVSTGTAPIDVKFDSVAGTSITATTSWQFVKVENKTLTAATRWFQILQTDTGSRTIYVKMAGVVLNSTYPGYLDGACGDARWNSTAHASTSTALTGQDAIDLAFDSLAELGEKAIYNQNVESSETGGTGLVGYWTPDGATKGRTLLTVKAVDVGGLNYDYDHHNNNLARCSVNLVCHPYALGPEQTWATGSKAAGAPALELDVSGVDGAIKGPARVTFTAGSLQDVRLARMGIQGRDRVSGTDLIYRAASFGTSGWSGSLTTKTDEVQTLSRTGTPASGTFTLTLDGKTTSSIAYNATAGTIQSALEALANIGSGNVSCSGGPIHTTNVVCTFQGDLAGCNVSLMTVTDSVGGGDITNALTTTGVPGYVSSALYESWTTICDTGNLTHIGSYQVMARVYDAAASSDLGKARIRLTWGLGDLASTTTNDSAAPQWVGDYSLVDLGQIHIPPVATGTQRWKGRIEGKTSGTAGNSIRIVDLMLFPVETGYGDIRIVDNTTGTLTLRDDFTQSAGAYTGKSMDLGGTVSGGGDADDFALNTTSDWIERTATGDTALTGRYVYAGSAVADCRVQVNLPGFVGSGSGGIYRRGVLMRWVDASNFAFAFTEADASVSPATYSLKIYKVIATARTLVASMIVPAAGTDLVLTGTARSDGSVSVSRSGYTLTAIDSVFATGGTLASGKMGMYDEVTGGTSGGTRVFDDFAAYTLPAPQVAIYASQDLQFRPTGDVLREDSAGSGIYSLMGNATVSHLPELTPSGSLGVTNRLLCLTSRNNPDLSSDPLPDAFDVTVSGRPVFALARSST